MSGAETDWLPAVGILGGGLILGALVAARNFAQTRRSIRVEREAGAVRDLAGKRDALIRQLQELEEIAGKRTGSQLAHERYALELEAARVMLALDNQEEAAKSRPPEPKAERHPAPGRRSRALLWGIGTATAAALLGLFVYQSAKPREVSGSVTGDVPGRGAGAGAKPPDEDAIHAALEKNPDDVEARLQLVRVALDKRDYLAVWSETGRILEKEPGNPRALTYQALVLIAMGKPDVAVDTLRKAIAADPDLVDAWAYLAFAQARMGRLPDARTTIAQASKRFPQRATEMARVLAQLEKRPPASGSDGGAGPGETPPGEATAEAGLAAPAPTVRHVSGVVELDASLSGKVAPGAVLFVFARAAGASGGPPIAVKRLPPTFPAAFDLSEKDSMMGQAFPDALLIEARLDADGDPTTKAPDDPRARLEDVRSGRTDVRLVLKAP